MPKYLSGRVKRTPQNRLSDDRYQYLGLDQAEPNMGDPPTTSGTPDVPVGQQYQLVSVLSHPGERFWKPVGGGLIPGSISVYDEGDLVGTISSITQLDFVGVGVAITAIPLGIAATITVTPPGDNGSVLFKERIFDPDGNSGVGTHRDDFATSSDLVFDSTVGILTVGKGLEVGDTGLKVGVGGTFLTVTSGIGSVGIGTTNPTQELDVNGDVRIRGTIYDYNNDSGEPSDILTKGINGLEWVTNNAVRSGAGGTAGQVQYHNDAGLIDGAEVFYYDATNDRVGIGSTQPNCLLDVDGKINLRGDVNIDAPYFTGISTFNGQLNADGGLVANTARIEDLIQTRVVFSGASGELVDDENFTYTTSTDTLDLINLSVNATAGISTLHVSGISTLGSVEVGLNTITTTSGALVLNANSGSIESEAGIFISDDTDSTTKDTGALTVDGGVGIEKNLNVGGAALLAGYVVSENTYNYQFTTVTTPTPEKVYFDQVSYTSISEIKIHKTDDDNTDRSALLTLLRVGDRIKIINGSATRTYNVTGDSTVDGDVYTIPISYSSETGTWTPLSTGNEIDLTITQRGESSVTLASSGGITTTGGDLYVAGDLYVESDISLDLGIFQELIVSPGVSTFKGDVEFWGNAGAAKSAYWDKDTASFNLVNTSKLYFGNSQELLIYHNGYDGNSYIEEAVSLSQ